MQVEGGCLRYVGRSPMENDISQVSEHVVEPGYTLWTVGYILQLEAAKTLIETEAHQNMRLGACPFGVSMQGTQSPLKLANGLKQTVGVASSETMLCYAVRCSAAFAQDPFGRLLFHLYGLWHGWPASAAEQWGVRMLMPLTLLNAKQQVCVL